ncbi:MAG: pilus assembly protein [Gemmatimonadetes bacterium]|nr:pilus assembly protein [Gemmatimonadota bacterium]
MSTARDDEGQAVVEFALVAPILILLLVGIFEFGRAWSAHQALTDAAREGARAAVVADLLVSEDSVRAIVRNALNRVSLDGSRAVIELSGVDAATGEPARVEVRYGYQFGLLKPLGAVLGNGGTVTLATAFVMRNE